ncbi:hypothetical protein L914_02206 [Phytophthora nicotianae]|uniref:Uncharacterized protein n=1 Tax=Phytophthora nicotianae TaxID=4792 RepID=W2P183_PHYNI|nr:hypothetical protein L914_02206 [Phytophthora nicotianae]
MEATLFYYDYIQELDIGFSNIFKIDMIGLIGLIGTISIYRFMKLYF